jgi:large subunit ribosomal protein L10
MAITREKKEEVVGKIAELASSSKLVVFARYAGLTVADMQTLRREGKVSNVTGTVAKNRLVKLALSQQPAFSATDAGFLSGQVVLAAGDDEVAPAAVLATFGKKHPALDIVGGLSSDGSFVDADGIKALASLPSKDVLRGQLVGTIAAPLSGFVRTLSGNISGLINVLNAQATK